MALAIAGIGTAVPNDSYDQREGLLIAQSLCCETQEQTTWLPNMYGQTGITKRHLCLGRALVDDVIHGTVQTQSAFLPNLAVNDRGPTTGERMKVYAEQAPLLACESATQSLENAGILAADITHLITVSCTGFYAPGWDIQLVRALGLPSTTQRTHVGFMGCHGALNGLRVARAFVDTDPHAKVLLCATELCSIHYHYGWDPQKVIANAIFADGSASLVGVSDRFVSGPWRLVDSAAQLVPETEQAMTWEIGDNGFSMTLAKRVPDIIRRDLRSFMEHWLRGQGLSIAAVQSWAIHPGGPKILDAAGEALGLSPAILQPARDVFSAHGNMSSPTVLFIVDHLQKLGSKPPCVALGFGPGINIEAALFR